MLFQVIRDALLHDGIPLGLATSGLSFARLSYFWSPAFWGGTSSFLISGRWKAMWLVSLIASGGLIAVTAGPASAVLMLPRLTVSFHTLSKLALQFGTNRSIRSGIILRPRSGSTEQLTFIGPQQSPPIMLVALRAKDLGACTI